MIIKTRKVYHCEYCKKHYLSKAPCVIHENECWNNPDNMNWCHRCAHMDHIDNDSDKYLRYKCTKKNIEIIPTPRVKKRKRLDMPMNEVKEMASNDNWCDDFKADGFPNQDQDFQDYIDNMNGSPFDR